MERKAPVARCGDDTLARRVRRWGGRWMAYLTIPHHRSSDTLPTHSVPRHLLKLTRVTQAQLRTTVVVAVAEEMPVEGAGGLEKNTTPFAIHLVVVLCWLRPHFGGWDGEGLRSRD